MKYENLIHQILADGVLKTPSLIQAFLKIDRRNFVKPQYANRSYDDRPLAIRPGATISQPSTVAFMLELLQVQEGDKVLDIGAGSAWTTTLLAELVGDKGQVFGTEYYQDVLDFGQENLNRYEYPNAKICLADKELGLASEAPFHKILVSAAAVSLPVKLIDQLDIGGRLVIPIQHSIWTIDKVSAYEVEKQEYIGFVFVPLM